MAGMVLNRPRLLHSRVICIILKTLKNNLPVKCNGRFMFIACSTVVFTRFYCTFDHIFKDKFRNIWPEFSTTVHCYYSIATAGACGRNVAVFSSMHIVLTPMYALKSYLHLTDRTSIPFYKTLRITQTYKKNPTDLTTVPYVVIWPWNAIGPDLIKSKGSKGPQKHIVMISLKYNKYQPLCSILL